MIRNRDWLRPWGVVYSEQAEVIERQESFANACQLLRREREQGRSFGFGLFVQGRFAGEVNLSAVGQPPAASADLGYWIDRDLAGHGYMPDALVLVLRFAFDELRLGRVNVWVAPHNHRSRRVLDKLGLSDQGIVNREGPGPADSGPRLRYRMTAEEWQERGSWLVTEWVV